MTYQKENATIEKLLFLLILKMAEKEQKLPKENIPKKLEIDPAKTIPYDH